MPLLAVDSESSEIQAVELTEAGVHDAEQYGHGDAMPVLVQPMLKEVGRPLVLNVERWA